MSLLAHGYAVEGQKVRFLLHVYCSIFSNIIIFICSETLGEKTLKHKKEFVPYSGGQVDNSFRSD